MRRGEGEEVKGKWVRWACFCPAIGIVSAAYRTKGEAVTAYGWLSKEHKGGCLKLVRIDLQERSVPGSAERGEK